VWERIVTGTQVVLRQGSEGHSFSCKFCILAVCLVSSIFFSLVYFVQPQDCINGENDNEYNTTVEHGRSCPRSISLPSYKPHGTSNTHVREVWYSYENWGTCVFFNTSPFFFEAMILLQFQVVTPAVPWEGSLLTKLWPSSPAPCNRWPWCMLHPFENIHGFDFF
jgi:hypothetical protein